MAQWRHLRGLQPAPPPCGKARKYSASCVPVCDPDPKRLDHPLLIPDPHNRLGMCLTRALPFLAFRSLGPFPRVDDTGRAAGRSLGFLTFVKSGYCGREPRLSFGSSSCPLVEVHWAPQSDQVTKREMPSRWRAMTGQCREGGRGG